MVKKNKNRAVDYFNMTPEEQMANAEMFHDVEQGEASFLDALNYKVPKAPIAQSDYTKQIEKACLGCIEEDEEETYLSKVGIAVNESSSHNENEFDEYIAHHVEVDNDDDYEDIDETPYIPYSSMTSVKETIIEKEIIVNDTDDSRKHTSNNNNDVECNNSYKKLSTSIIPRVHFHYEPIVGKMLIDDGLVSTPVSICHTSSLNINSDMIPDDDDNLGQLVSKIFYFIITCKHPAVIMSENTFEIEFSMYSKINTNKFIFFKNDGFVYAYVLDEDAAENFYSVADLFNMDDADILRYIIGTAFAANTMHNIFMYNDSDEVESVMEARHAVKDLIELVEKDSNTEYAGHNASGSVLTRMGVTDLQSFVTEVRELLEDFLVDNNDDDDEEDDEVEDDETDDDDFDSDDSDDVDIMDYPDIDKDENIDDIDKMLENIDSDEVSKTTVIETKIEIEKVASNETDDMVLPVIHRRS